MIRYDVWVRIQIEAPDPVQAYQQTQSIQTLIQHPFVRGQFENEGVRIVGDFMVLMPQEQRPA